jgi:hypothetical protein
MPAYTWATGETITAAKLNALETEAWRAANTIDHARVTASFSTNSTSYVDVTSATVTFTAKSTTALIIALLGNVSHSTSDGRAAVGININSTDYDISVIDIDNTSSYYAACGSYLATGLTAGNNYTAKLRLKTSGGTVRLHNGGGASSIAIFDISK